MSRIGAFIARFFPLCLAQEGINRPSEVVNAETAVEETLDQVRPLHGALMHRGFRWHDHFYLPA